MADAEYHQERIAWLRVVEQRERHSQRLDYITATVLFVLVVFSLLTLFLPTPPPASAAAAAAAVPSATGVRTVPTPAAPTPRLRVAPETQTWARTFLSAIGGAVVAFVARGRGGRPASPRREGPPPAT